MVRHPAIRALHWSAIPETETPVWLERGYRLYAIWPAPVNYDACFEGAGFHDFADNDDTWYTEFAAILQHAIDQLGSLGQPTIRQRIEFRRPLLARLFKPAEEPSLLDQLIAPTFDDDFPACIIDFGTPPTATLRTGEGHEMMWLMIGAYEHVDVAALAAHAAEGRPVYQTNLAWTYLV